MVPSSIQNLIFDLGGVILDLHFDRTHDAFSKAAGRTLPEWRGMMEGNAFFNLYEKGLLTDNEFRSELRTLLQTNLPDSEIDSAWNAMLGAIPLERLQILKSLRGKYRTFLLSNTNSIHVQFFSKVVERTTGEPGLESFFEHAHYSNVLKMRKPDLEIYEHVVKRHTLDPGATMFFDDHLPNLEGAARAGLKTFHVDQPQRWMSLFS